MLSIEAYRKAFDTALTEKLVTKEPKNLYEPINYILQLGGKRLRPVLTMMMADIYGHPYQKAINAGLAIEVFHNFSLVHDDIMDDAPLRRGKETVHEKWDLNTGILSGDAMLIMAYQLFETYDAATYFKLTQLFSRTAIEVCEGQQYDIDFETRTDVTIPEYLKMIKYKTAVLVAAAMKMGAIIAGASDQEAQKVYDFGINLGLAFQLKDDYLDAFGDPKTFGKQVGGDIIENKKTYLYLQAEALATQADRIELQELFASQPVDPASKIKRAKALFVSSGSAAMTEQAIKEYTDKAFEVLEGLDVEERSRKGLKQFGNWLLNRTT